MANRIGIKQLEESAKAMSVLTGCEFEIRVSQSGQAYNLLQKGTGSGYQTIKAGMSGRELYDWMYTFHAGIEEGMRLTNANINGPKMPKATNPKGLRNPDLLVFKGTFFVVLEEQLPDDEAERDYKQSPLTTEEIAEFLEEAVVLDVDLENNDNTVGFQSMQLHYTTLEQMTEEELAKYYGK